MKLLTVVGGDDFHERNVVVMWWWWWKMVVNGLELYALRKMLPTHLLHQQRCYSSWVDLWPLRSEGCDSVVLQHCYRPCLWTWSWGKLSTSLSIFQTYLVVVCTYFHLFFWTLEVKIHTQRLYIILEWKIMTQVITTEVHVHLYGYTRNISEQQTLPVSVIADSCQTPYSKVITAGLFDCYGKSEQFLSIIFRI